MLVLDAQSAFDRCLRQILCSELFKAGVSGTALIMIDNLLSSRATVYQWDGELLGPAKDETGFEQGGINSGDYYKLYNNEQLTTAQSSSLGVDIGSSIVSAVGVADDVILAANDIDSLRLLARLTETYCAKYRVKLVPSKTKLLPVSAPRHYYLVNYAELVNPVTINGTSVNFVSEAEHVGVVRSRAGNMPNILQRISAHKKALAAVSPAGMTHCQRGNPAAALRVHQLYATSVLFSGLASLVLSRAELKVIDTYYKRTLQNLQRLHQNTPRAVVFFLAGSLPGEAIFHSRQLSLFSMICNLPQDPLHTHARYILSEAPPSAKSWFQQVRDLCSQYGLPHPLQLLENPPSKKWFKGQVKLKILQYWQDVLRAEARPLSSLQYFKPDFYSLSRPHYIWTSAASNPFECSKCTVLAKMVSGRYRTEKLCRFWSDNRSGYCKAPTCHQVIGSLEHLLVVCPAVEPVRARLYQMWLERTVQFPSLHSLILSVLKSPESVKVQFILEPMAFPLIIFLFQQHGHPIIEQVSYITRTFAFYIHKEKQKILGNWPSKKQPKQSSKVSSCAQNKDNLDGRARNAHQTNPIYFPGTSDEPTQDRDQSATTNSQLPQIPSQKDDTTQPSSSAGPTDCVKPASSSAKLSMTYPQQPSNLLASPLGVPGLRQGESGLHFGSTFPGHNQQNSVKF